MTDIATLETETLSAIGAAHSLDVLESVRIAALGKAGWITGLLKTLGG